MPAVASTMVAPEVSRPSRSAASIIDSAMRSLIEPPGFWLSSLTNSRHGPVSRRVTSTTGVFPTRARTFGFTEGAVMAFTRGLLMDKAGRCMTALYLLYK